MRLIVFGAVMAASDLRLMKWMWLLQLCVSMHATRHALLSADAGVISPQTMRSPVFAAVFGFRRNGFWDCLPVAHAEHVICGGGLINACGKPLTMLALVMVCNVAG
eukprot:Plantae.Rhodophyta-Hildenbrandia_rubra.ctg61029.p3 GENE.Plantae.Rhodophyta-Hildenbrandia_rubra.ctg61029~~Plantae.Rhodophyta-Hildenbrandia_rubra.ctg61029.p3  ORF type:complete len:106 (+),score=14.74 Plantae.Rhodophyta-Hildenbrandia_rubra.ctg61029:390-707(+)